MNPFSRRHLNCPNFRVACDARSGEAPLLIGFRALTLSVGLSVFFLPVAVCATALDAYRGAGQDGVTYQVRLGEAATEVVVTGTSLADDSFFVALASPDHTGSLIVPFEKGREGSTVFLPFKAGTILLTGPSGNFLRRWEGTQWGDLRPAGRDFTVTRSPGQLALTIPAVLAGPAKTFKMAAYFKDLSDSGGWGWLYGAVDPADASGPGDIVLRGYVGAQTSGGGLTLQNRGNAAKVRIYQLLPRIFGNTNETRKPNGTLEENGSGRFSDLNETSLVAIKGLGFTHVWPTGVLQQATATDYSGIGEPADDPDLLKGLAGSPYAIKDYFDVSPDYADDPARRLEEFQAMVGRVHQAGLKVIMDFVPNHVARSHQSSIRPGLSFGAEDDRTKFFRADNNFFWLTPEAKPFGKGPPLRLPTVDAQGNPTSPTCKVAKAPSDGLFAPEAEHGRVTGSNLASWEPDAGSWYETVKLNYGFDFSDPTKQTRAYPHGAKSDVPNPDTWRKMDEIIAYWQDFGVDGFRVDMAHMVPPEFWHWMIARARTRNPAVFFAAEAYDTDPAKVPAGDPLVAQVGGGNVMFDLLNAGFDAVYDDATYDKVKEIYEGKAWANDLDAITARQVVFDNSLRYAENHDEVRLAAKDQWDGIGMEVGRPVTALLFGLSRGPAMLYSGQEVGEPADGAEGFGEDDARTSIFDYWAMPEFAKWVNGKKFDGGRLSSAQGDLRSFYGQLLTVIGEPAFHQGGFFPLNPANAENPSFGRVPGENASGHWLYSFLRRDPASGQKFLVVINLHRSLPFDNVRITLPPAALDFLGLQETSKIKLTEKLGTAATIETTAASGRGEGVPVGKISPLTPLFFEVTNL